MIRRLLLLALVASLSLACLAQGRLDGRVLDKQSKEPMPYVAVSLLRIADSSLVTGTMTQDNGSFNLPKLPFGSYLIRIQTMGYGAHYQAVHLTANAAVAHLGRIELAPQTTMLEGVEITAERTMVEYKLDKRVVNVDQNIVASGGTASDVLEQVPSVTVDNDGNVALRGSTNVKVLINGRPYELMGADLSTILEQIPANTVENVEIITNPSAKYDPEGMSGIINLKLKDNNSYARGWNGILNLNCGSPFPSAVPQAMLQYGLLNAPFIPSTSGSVNLNYGTEKLTFTLSADLGSRSHGICSQSFFQRSPLGTTTSIDSLYQYSLNQGTMGSIKTSLEFRPNKYNTLNFSYALRSGMRNQQSLVRSIDLLDDAFPMDYLQHDSNLNSNGAHIFNLNYKRTFDRPEQELTFDASYTLRHREADGLQWQNYDNPAIHLDHWYLRQTQTRNRNNTANLQLNYVHPLAEGIRLETGYEGRMTFTDQNYTQWMSQFADNNVVTALDDIASKNYIFNQQVHAIYLTYAAKFSEKLSAQAGLRGEYSDVYGLDRNHLDIRPIDTFYLQLYPTLHLSYEINPSQSLQLSYSRRVRRPHMHDLHPNLEINQGNQMYFGNPGINPEFTNAFELSYNLTLHRTNIFSSLYLRQTNNMVTHYGFIWSQESAAHYAPWMVYDPAYDGYWASTPQNLAQGVNSGLELILDHQPAKWCKFNLSINLFQNHIEATELIQGLSQDALRCDLKFTSFMALPHDFTIQLSAQYRSPSNDLQTFSHSSYWADLAVKKDILAKRATLSLRVADLLCTASWGHLTDDQGLYRTVEGRRLSPHVSLGFTYKINKGLQQNSQSSDEDSDE